MKRFLFSLLFFGSAAFAQEHVITLYPGYVTRVVCSGRLLISAIGSDALVRLEALPKELGCGVLIKPSTAQGETNLILETSSSSYKSTVRIISGQRPRASDLEIELKEDQE
jgi:hypothetical protein